MHTSLSQAVFDELHVPVEKIELVMSDTQLRPYDAGTLGSQTTPTMNLQPRRVAATRDTYLPCVSNRLYRFGSIRFLSSEAKLSHHHFSSAL